MVGKLLSLNREQWTPGRPLVSWCRVTSRTSSPHKSPVDDCWCGIYAAKDTGHLRRFHYDQIGIVGEVSLWGRVVEHELGWRGEYAYPKCFLLAANELPYTLAELDRKLESLRAFGADIYLPKDTERVLFWRRDSGYHAEGVDHLLTSRKEIYQRLLDERTLRPGNRIAILGRGIAVVVSTDEKSVIAMFRGRYPVRIPRKDAELNHQNMRWECAGDTAVYLPMEQTA